LIEKTLSSKLQFGPDCVHIVSRQFLLKNPINKVSVQAVHQKDAFLNAKFFNMFCTKKRYLKILAIESVWTVWTVWTKPLYKQFFVCLCLDQTWTEPGPR